MESIKDKLRKIKALADKGVAGEATAAQAQLEKLLVKYNMRIEDIFDDTMKERRFKISKDNEQLFMQILLSIIGNRAKETWHYKGQRPVKYINLTDAEFIDVSQQVDFHKKQIAKERKKALETLEYAYVHKHNLFNIEKSDTPSESKITLKEYLDIMAMKDRLENVTFRKQLNK